MPASTDNRYKRGDGLRDRSFRVGDKERESVGEILREAHLEGRLDSDEFQSRLERCMTAKTYADLDVLIADVPQGADERRRPRPLWIRRPWPLVFLLPLALIVAIAVGGHFAWLAIPLFFFFIVRPLVWGSWGGRYGRGAWACAPRRTTRV